MVPILLGNRPKQNVDSQHFVFEALLQTQKVKNICFRVYTLRVYALLLGITAFLVRVIDSNWPQYARKLALFKIAKPKLCNNKTLWLRQNFIRRFFRRSLAKANHKTEDIHINTSTNLFHIKIKN